MQQLWQSSKGSNLKRSTTSHKSTADSEVSRCYSLKLQPKVSNRSSSDERRNLPPLDGFLIRGLPWQMSFESFECPLVEVNWPCWKCQFSRSNDGPKRQKKKHTQTSGIQGFGEGSSLEDGGESDGNFDERLKSPPNLLWNLKELAVSYGWVEEISWVHIVQKCIYIYNIYYIFIYGNYISLGHCLGQKLRGLGNRLGHSDRDWLVVDFHHGHIFMEKEIPNLEAIIFAPPFNVGDGKSRKFHQRQHLNMQKPTKNSQK